MKSKFLFVCYAVSVVSVAAVAGPDRLFSEEHGAVAALPIVVSNGDVSRPQLARKRPAYDVRSLTIPVDRSFEVLEGDAIAWRSARRMLA